MIEPGWIMDSECCSGCGALLNFWESDLCFDCMEDEVYNEEQRLNDIFWEEDEEQRLNDIFWEEDEEPTIGTPEEAYAVALSLSDEESEQLCEDEE